MWNWCVLPQNYSASQHCLGTAAISRGNGKVPYLHAKGSAPEHVNYIMFAHDSNQHLTEHGQLPRIPRYPCSVCVRPTTTSTRQAVSRSALTGSCERIVQFIRETNISSIVG